MINKMELECDFCNKIFSTSGNLKYHKRTSKKCQLIQVQNFKDEKIESSLINCDFCDKKFTVQTLKTHTKNCKKKTEFEIQKLLEENQKLLEENQKLQIRIVELETENKIYLQDREVVQKLALQPKTTNNNDNRIKINNNFFDNPERIKQMINEKLNKDYISDGQKGVAQFACNNLLKDENGNMNYICSDPSRHIFKFQNSEGNIEKDVKAIKLTNMLIEAGITHKTLSIAPSLWTEEDGIINSNKFQTYAPYTSEITAMQLDNTIFRNELACLTSL
jgi:hypothetical protein